MKLLFSISFNIQTYTLVIFVVVFYFFNKIKINISDMQYDLLYNFLFSNTTIF